ncbi:NADPH-dependent F420 reductase [Enterococcus sp. DIV0876]|uniref:NADPH-dependent F420 reductase n=1 Tax=Enterococcus sp. DIV0876 TaxID=2774633 RepID=UPI003D2FFA3B
MAKQTIGIIGAGKLGLALANIGAQAGYDVLIASRKTAEQLALPVSVLAPGAKALSVKEVIAQAETIVLAIPLSKYQQLDPEAFRGKIIIDAMNYWWEVDGKDEVFSTIEATSSERVQQYFVYSQVVKAFNHMGYHDIQAVSSFAGDTEVKAIAVAGDQSEAVAKVAQIVKDFGFDPLLIGSLANGLMLEPGSPLFGANETANKLQQLINDFDHSEKGQAFHAQRAPL